MSNCYRHRQLRPSFFTQAWWPCNLATLSASCRGCLLLADLALARAALLRHLAHSAKHRDSPGEGHVAEGRWQIPRMRLKGRDAMCLDCPGLPQLSMPEHHCTGMSRFNALWISAPYSMEPCGLAFPPRSGLNNCESLVLCLVSYLLAQCRNTQSEKMPQPRQVCVWRSVAPMKG